MLVSLRLSQNIAGVTIMALGNGAPDIFSAMAGIGQDRPDLVFGSLFGAGVFVTAAVAGCVSVTRPFKLMERPFLRDVSFYLLAGFWAFYIFWRQEIRLLDSIGFLVVYLIYMAVVVVGRYIHQKNRTEIPHLTQVFVSLLHFFTLHLSPLTPRRTAMVERARLRSVLQFTPQ